MCCRRAGTESFPRGCDAALGSGVAKGRTEACIAASHQGWGVSENLAFHS